MAPAHALSVVTDVSLRTGAPCSPGRTWAENDWATPDSCHAAPPTSACAAFIKESRMESTSAIKLNRKSGGKPNQRSFFFFLPLRRWDNQFLFPRHRSDNETHDPCVFLHTQSDVFQPPPQNRHPERSASPIYRIPEDLWRVVEGPRRCLLADAIRSFPATEPSCIPQFDSSPVSSHDLSRAIKPTTKEGLSPCISSVHPRKVNPCHAKP